MIAIFNPPGNMMSALPEDFCGPVLLARLTRIYSSGPSTNLNVWWVENQQASCAVEPHSQPLTEFQRWWPLPTVSYESPTS